MNRRFTFSESLRKANRHRSLVAILIGVGALIGWSFAGSHVITALNPAFRHELSVAMRPALDVWITPPDYASGSPMIISTPAGPRFDHDTLTVAQGSTISAHLAEQGGDAPELVVDGDDTPFTTDAHGDYAATQKLTAGKTLSIRRGWLTLASWKINVVADEAPKVSLTEPLSITASRSLRVAYTASDNFAVDEVAVRVTPHDPSPGASNKPVDIALPAAKAKTMTRVDFADLTARPWAGQQVTIQLVATNEAGKSAASEPVDFTLPERAFFHPVARVLIEERKKLLQHPDDEALRDEAANIMAGIAHEAADYHGDPVVLMALRTGAVRLILDHGHQTALSVNDLLWQAATRIEDGYAGEAQQMLHDARQDLAEAIGRNAGPEEILTLTQRLQKAMEVYLQQVAAHHTIRPHDQAQAGFSNIQ